MVVIWRSAAALSGSEHDRAGTPSTCTVQAPHWAIPQPYLVPIRPITSRSTQSSGVSASTSTSCGRPLTVRRAIKPPPDRTRDAQGFEQPRRSQNKCDIFSNQ
jgi:hypothetical protein